MNCLQFVTNLVKNWNNKLFLGFLSYGRGKIDREVVFVNSFIFFGLNKVSKKNSYFFGINYFLDLYH